MISQFLENMEKLTSLQELDLSNNVISKLDKLYRFVTPVARTDTRTRTRVCARAYASAHSARADTRKLLP